MKLKRGYLNSEEKNFFFILQAFVQLMSGIRGREEEAPVSEDVWTVWKKRGMMNSEMQKDLKMAKTYLQRFTIELNSNLDKEQVERINKQLYKFNYRLVDDYTLKKVMRDVNDHMEYVSMKRDYFIELLEDVAEHKCVNCTKCYKECSLFKALDDINVPYDGEEPNCPYACNMMLTKNDLKDIKKVEAKIVKSKKKRKEA